MGETEKKRKIEVVFVDPNPDGDFLKLLRVVTREKLETLIFEERSRGRRESFEANGERVEKRNEANENSSVLSRFD